MMGAFENFVANNEVLDEQAQLTIKGGAYYCREFADGRRICYNSGGSVTYYPDGRVYYIEYGRDAFWM